MCITQLKLITLWTIQEKIAPLTDINGKQKENHTLSYIFLKLTVRLLFIYYWSIADYCLSFRCTAKWFSYTYKYIFFQILFPYMLLQNTEYSVLHSRSLVVICFIYNTVYLLIPNSSFMPLPTFPFSKHKFVFYVFDFTSVLYLGFFFYSTYKWYMVSVFLWLTSPSIMISRPIYVPANSIISFFFMA